MLTYNTIPCWILHINNNERKKQNENPLLLRVYFFSLYIPWPEALIFFKIMSFKKSIILHFLTIYHPVTHRAVSVGQAHQVALTENKTT